MSKVLVTGGAGFIGSHIVEELVSRNYKVVVLDDFSTGQKSNLENVKDRIKIITGSITKKEVVDKAMKGIEYVFHHAAFVSVPESIKKPKTTWDINIRGTKLLLNAAVKNKVKRFVFASSAAVYGNNPKLPKNESMKLEPISPYAQSKRMGEIMCEQYREKEGLSTICLRYFNVFGPRQNPYSEYSGVISKFIGSFAMNQQPTIFGDGEQTRDFIFINDVVQANMLAMDKKVGGSFNIATGESTTINKLLETINKAMNKNIAPRYHNQREGDIKFSYADIQKAKKYLSFKPEYSFEEGIKETIGWYVQK